MSATRRVLRRAERNVLEAVVRLGRRKAVGLVVEAGYAYGYVIATLVTLRGLQLVEKGCGGYEATERGKIALAITMAKEARARRRYR